eukprot:763376-Hanusia_phi.AAC.3
MKCFIDLSLHVSSKPRLTPVKHVSQGKSYVCRKYVTSRSGSGVITQKRSASRSVVMGGRIFQLASFV